MNAVVALCTFCELHGPSVLFCTQAFREDQEFHLSGCSSTKNSQGSSTKSWYGPTSLVKGRRGKNGFTIPPLRSDGCEGCTSMNVKIKGIISNDHEARVSYISSQYPLHPNLFSIVRQACVRSLSCEVCPGREGPIFFGDNHRGHVFSHTFFLKDTMARGLQSWYSIIIVMMDQIFLLNSWQFLVKNIQYIIRELKGQTVKVFNTEHNQHVAPLNSVIGMNIKTFRRLRGNVKARSIIDLTGNKTVFIDLHMWFTWILKAGAERVVEKITEILPFEKKIIDFEREEETEEGFIKVHIKSDREDSLSEMMNKIHLPIKTIETNESNTQELRFVFKSIRHIYKILGPEKFHCLAYHTIVGNQIIIKSKFLSLMKSIITHMKDLIPAGCYHPIYYSVTYEDSWKCNFLGLLPDTHIPDHVHSSELHIEIDVTKREEAKDIESVNDFDFVFHSTAQIPEKVPQVLMKMEQAIMSDLMPLSALEKFLAAQKDIWMNKVKVLFLFSRTKQRTEEESAKLLKSLDSTDFDKPLLKFWMNGLSIKYKTDVLANAVQS